mmetsp:Transcript_6108/g.14304  ORF Transcript_6108/g.14304 Transcript_6108/m.14304 type:complete len:269 (-) Transcript_6108:2433-3239(-)
MHTHRSVDLKPAAVVAEALVRRQPAAQVGGRRVVRRPEVVEVGGIARCRARRRRHGREVDPAGHGVVGQLDLHRVPPVPSRQGRVAQVAQRGVQVPRGAVGDEGRVLVAVAELKGEACGGPQVEDTLGAAQAQRQHAIARRGVHVRDRHRLVEALVRLRVALLAEAPLGHEGGATALVRGEVERPVVHAELRRPVGVECVEVEVEVVVGLVEGTGRARLGSVRRPHLHPTRAAAALARPRVRPELAVVGREEEGGRGGKGARGELGDE